MNDIPSIKRAYPKVASISYHRNGVHGEPFYSVTLINLKDCSGVFFCTFTTINNDTKVKTESCRCLNSADSTMRYRGDEVAELLDKLRERNDCRTFYDMIQKFLN